MSLRDCKLGIRDKSAGVEAMVEFNGGVKTRINLIPYLQRDDSPTGERAFAVNIRFDFRDLQQMLWHNKTSLLV